MAKWHADHMCVIYFKRNKRRRVEKNLSFYQLKFNVCVHCIWRPLGQYILTYIYLDVVFFMLKKNSKFWRLKQNKKKEQKRFEWMKTLLRRWFICCNVLFELCCYTNKFKRLFLEMIIFLPDIQWRIIMHALTY